MSLSNKIKSTAAWLLALLAFTYPVSNDDAKQIPLWVAILICLIALGFFGLVAFLVLSILL